MIYLAVVLFVSLVVVALAFARRGSAIGSAGPGGTGALAPVLGGVAVVAAAVFLLGGSEDGSDGGPPVMLLGLVAALALAGLALTLLHRRQSAVLPERPWSAPVAAAVPGSGRAGASPARAVALALGRVEGRQFTASAWFAVGLAFSVLIILLFGIIWAGDNTGTWQELVDLTPWFAHPLVGMVVLAAYRATTRAARDGADELFETCPTAPATRTAGFLLSAAVPVATLGVFLAVMATAVAFKSPLLHGALDVDSGAVVLGALVLGAGGVALGVALGRWVRFGLVPVVAVVLIGFFATAVVNGSSPHNWKPLSALSTAPTVNSLSPVFADRAAYWHLLWLIGLTAAVGIVAVGRHRRDRPVALAAAAAAVVVLAAGIGATRPMPSASAARIADRVASPERHQICAATDGPVDVCVYRFHHELLRRMTDEVGPVAAALPAGMARLTLRQVFDRDLGDLAPEVRRRLTATDLERPAGEVALGFGANSAHGRDGAGFDLAFVSLGLPQEPDEELLPTVIAGQARGVVALWLATRGADAAGVRSATNADHAGSADAFDRGSLETGMCSVPPVVWSAQDLAAARAVVALPATQVAGVVTAGWARWSDPRTGTDEFLAALGLPAVGPFDQVVARPGEPC